MVEHIFPGYQARTFQSYVLYATHSKSTWLTLIYAIASNKLLFNNVLRVGTTKNYLELQTENK